jgi:hypothetical protein
VRQTVSFGVRHKKKTWSAAPKIKRDDNGNKQEFADRRK